MNKPLPYATNGQSFPLILAPMAGVSERPFRLLCRRYGADVVVSEFLSAEGLRRGSERSLEMAAFDAEERPIGIQIFGSEPASMAEATALVTEHFGPDFVDINFGCPVKKVVKRNGGSGCLRDMSLVQSIIRACVTATHLPLTVKIRSGWDETTRDPVTIALRCQEAGARALTLHARSRTQMFSGEANWDEIARVVEALEIPVIGNGDVSSPEDVVRMRDHTGCAAVMIARGSFGNPWIFARARALLDGRPVPPLLAFASGCGKNQEPTADQAPAIDAGNSFDPSKGTAHIAGRIRFEGPVPPSAQIKMNADPVCVSMHKEPVASEELIIVDGNLANAFVYVKEGLGGYSFAVPLEPVTLSQEGCRFVPHVGGIRINQNLRMVNNDPTLHNVNCMAEKNPQFNLGQPIKGAESVRKFSNPEVMVKFRCAVHKWMTSYLGVLPHPFFAVTGKDGLFSLRGLPPGEYLIEAWHEKLGTQSVRIVIGDKETKEIGFSFKAS